MIDEAAIDKANEAYWGFVVHHAKVAFQQYEALRHAIEAYEAAKQPYAAGGKDTNSPVCKDSPEQCKQTTRPTDAELVEMLLSAPTFVKSISYADLRGAADCALRIWKPYLKAEG